MDGAEVTAVVPSPFVGHRMRARLHADASGRVGFLAPRSHDLDASDSSLEALLPATRALLAGLPLLPPGPVELLENVSGSQRVLLVARSVDLAASQLDPAWTAVAHGRDRVLVRGTSLAVWDEEEEDGGGGGKSWGGLRRSAGSFFQGNRHLLDSLVHATLAPISSSGPLWDLYAGGGLFSAAAVSAHPGLAVTAVERSSADLEDNAARFGFESVPQDVLSFLRSQERGCETAVLDPPRVGCEAEVLELLARHAAVVVFIGCDVATTARDVRRLQDRGMRVTSCAALDMFPYSAQVEAVITLRQ
jgi:tRNA/tmRNA/rRNA uracil-C5-methylase (TrmA/RlmC/RlmD family)